MRTSRSTIKQNLKKKHSRGNKLFRQLLQSSVILPYGQAYALELSRTRNQVLVSDPSQRAVIWRSLYRLEDGLDAGVLWMMTPPPSGGRCTVHGACALRQVSTPTNDVDHVVRSTADHSSQMCRHLATDRSVGERCTRAGVVRHPSDGINLTSTDWFTGKLVLF